MIRIWGRWLKARFVASLFMFAGLIIGVSVNGKSLDEIVLIVDDTAITGREFSVLKFLKDPNQRYRPASPVQGEQATEEIIDELILASHAQRVAKGFQVPDVQLKASINTLAAQNKLSAEKLVQRLENDGVDIAIFEDSMRKRLLIQMILGRGLAQNIKVTPTQIQEFIDSSPELRRLTEKNYHVSHLMLPIDSESSKKDIEAMREMAQKIQTQLKNGISFEQVIASNQSVQSSSQNGDLGWKKQGELPTLFVKTLESLGKGEISKVLDTENGLHILALTDVQSALGYDKEYRVSHILKLVPAIADSEPLKRELINIKQKILVGIAFKTLAEQESHDVGSASKGGDLGWISPPQVDKEFALALKSLRPGEISDPVKTKFGWHLIKLQQVREHTNNKILQNNIKQQVLATKVNERMAELLNDLRQVALIEVLVP